ncbi:A24 family peptidase [Vibrio tubiashii]|uniref:A24 family peptidase n=1 Tax=Vibrio tubiashii TaxID=29498 RepID=UPI003CE5BAD8
MDVLVWVVLFAVAVSDAKEHRIPNTFLLTIIAIVFINNAFVVGDFSLLAWSLFSSITCFICALILYLLKVMAPGDVKLMGVVGFWLGSEHTLNAVFWIAVSSVMIGLLYALQRMAQSPEQTKVLIKKYSIFALYGVSSTKALGEKRSMEEHYRMPFAPVVVVGVAMSQYF